MRISEQDHAGCFVLLASLVSEAQKR